MNHQGFFARLADDELGRPAADVDDEQRFAGESGRRAGEAETRLALAGNHGQLDAQRAQARDELVGVRGITRCRRRHRDDGNLGLLGRAEPIEGRQVFADLGLDAVDGFGFQRTGRIHALTQVHDAVFAVERGYAPFVHIGNEHTASDGSDIDSCKTLVCIRRPPPYLRTTIREMASSSAPMPMV